MTALTRPGYKFITKVPRGQRVVGMVAHQNVVYVATDRRVYRLQGKTLVPLSFKVPA